MTLGFARVVSFVVERDEMNARNLSRHFAQFQLVLAVDLNCTSCGQVKSRRNSLECDLDGALKFVCADCVARFDDADRLADELLDYLDRGGAA